jgi:hypothetical protein
MVFVVARVGRVGFVLHVGRASEHGLESEDLAALGARCSRAGTLVQFAVKGRDLVIRGYVDAREGLSVSAVSRVVELLVAACECVEDVTSGPSWREELLPTAAELVHRPWRPRPVDPNVWTSRAYVEGEDELFDQERRALRAELLRLDRTATSNCGFVHEDCLDPFPELKKRWEEIHAAAARRAHQAKRPPIAAVRTRWLTTRGWSVHHLAPS